MRQAIFGISVKLKGSKDYTSFGEYHTEIALLNVAGWLIQRNDVTGIFFYNAETKAESKHTRKLNLNTFHKTLESIGCFEG